jgi:HK97 family phage portal protein
MLHDMPNPYTPANRFWSTVGVHLLLWGNAFIEMLRDETGLVVELRLLHPSLVQVEFLDTVGAKRFKVGRTWGTQTTLDEDRVLHIFGLSLDGLVGMSPIQQARESLGTAKARERFEGEVYGQRPYLSGVIKHPGQLADGGKRLRESWRSIYSGGGRHGVGVLEEGSEFVPITAPLEDMQFVQAAQLSKTQIANIFKLPASYIGGSTGDSLTYATVESNQIHFVRNALTPLAHNIAFSVSKCPGLFPFSSWYAEFVMEGLLRGDSKARAEVYQMLSAVKAITPDEIRERENMPPLTPAQREELNPPVPPALAGPADEPSDDPSIISTDA